MRAEQAIYTSARTKRTRGYHLVSQSPGIDEELARSLTRWCPSHGGLASSQTDAASINFQPLNDGWVALSRTIYGGPEYSSRGGLQVVTRVMLLRYEQLAGYDSDPVMLAIVALSLGHLRLEASVPEELPLIELPDRPLRVPYPDCDGPTTAAVHHLWNCVTSGKRVAVLGMPNPMAAVAELFTRIPERKRLDISFTTGLKPSMYRPFQLHFLPEADFALQQLLVSQGVSLLSCEPPSHSSPNRTGITSFETAPAGVPTRVIGMGVPGRA
jgi:hypothetical protein